MKRQYAGPRTTAQLIRRLTTDTGDIPEFGGYYMTRLQPHVFEGLVVGIQMLGPVPGIRPRLDVRVRTLDDGRVTERGVRRVQLLHHVRQFTGLAPGDWTVGRFERMSRSHGWQWAAVAHKSPRQNELLP
ncbi:hypothetical protein ACGFYQ_27355 [Streptomyces sp. NPDC048258]|uniref:hypothetical protein n=1 Tax=Streptomyces sp. NPDC048258 TaxID=3365527 RepID=UPI003714E2EB